eukprot:CAMPEP_0175164914 /NCGR_PEP_ID=MMETSP0087-20121206/26720_1 /TAXON_ID=136419 /ORGANISM="Unknown Unknown, Strain D1" /LENGTH=551 /DNA_ID=CAMNT_0016454083 /DNA_START=11 /DNA_END=1667 /DNA_ORIENTATION=-
MTEFACFSWSHSHPWSPVWPSLKRLLKFLVLQPPTWIFRVIRLILFVLCLLPAIARAGFSYLTSKRIIRNIRFGPEARNFLDIYLPSRQFKKKNNGKAPTAVFVTGGVWIIGYKAWGFFIGKFLAWNGVVTVMPDYRNFPQGTVTDMLSDVDQAIQWAVDNVDKYGGDPDAVYLIGQSAGAHLLSLTVLHKAQAEAAAARAAASTAASKHQQHTSPAAATTTADEGADEDKQGSDATLTEVQVLKQGLSCVRTKSAAFTDGVNNNGFCKSPWQLSNIQGVVGLSGVYDLVGCREAFHRKGLYRPILHAIVEGQDNLARFSPVNVLHTDAAFSDPEVVQRLPDFFVLHGTGDACVDSSFAETFVEALCAKQVPVSFKLYPGKSHTDPIMEDHIWTSNPVTVVAYDIVSVLRYHHLCDPDSVNVTSLDLPSHPRVKDADPVAFAAMQMQVASTAGESGRPTGEAAAQVASSAPQPPGVHLNLPLFQNIHFQKMSNRWVQRRCRTRFWESLSAIESSHLQPSNGLDLSTQNSMMEFTQGLEVYGKLGLGTNAAG